MENTITLRHACVAYLAAVTAAAVCCTVTSFAGNSLSQVAPMLGIAWIGAFIGGLLPYILAIQRANKLGIRSWAYFAGCGTLAALSAALLVIGLDAFACGEEENSSNMLGMLLLLAASGAVGGTASWFALRVQARLDTRVRMS